MCPECISTAAMLTAGVSSAGGVGALVLSKLRGRKRSRVDRETTSDFVEPTSASFEEWITAVQALEQNQQH